MCPQSKTINQGLDSDPGGNRLGSARPSPCLVSYQHRAWVLEALFGLIFKYTNSTCVSGVAGCALLAQLVWSQTVHVRVGATNSACVSRVVGTACLILLRSWIHLWIATPKSPAQLWYVIYVDRTYQSTDRRKKCRHHFGPEGVFVYIQRTPLYKST